MRQAFFPCSRLDAALSSRSHNQAMQNDAVTDSELAEQRLNAERFKHELAQASGGLLHAESIRVMLGFSTRDEVYRAATERRILAVEDDGQLRFPFCQFGCPPTVTCATARIGNSAKDKATGSIRASRAGEVEHPCLARTPRRITGKLRLP